MSDLSLGAFQSVINKGIKTIYIIKLVQHYHHSFNILCHLQFFYSMVQQAKIDWILSYSATCVI